MYLLINIYFIMFIKYMKSTKYIDFLMENKPYTDDKINKVVTKNQTGGRIPKDIVNRPTGGFPPIFLCTVDTETKEQVKEETKKKHGYTTKSIVDISHILNQRRHIKSNKFIQL